MSLRRLEHAVENLFVPSVRDVMTRSVVTIRPTASVMEAVDLMIEKHIGSVVVVDKGRPIGIFTQSDLFNRVLKTGASPEETKVCTVMTQPVITLRPEDKISLAIERMREEKISYLVITKGEELVGIVTLTDIRLKYSRGYMHPRLILKRYLVDTVAYISFWSGISFVIQVMVVGLTFQQLVAGSIIGFAVQIALGGPFGRYLDLLRSRFEV
ncbi:MAG: L-alanine exporter AlaE [Candidatus Bathyarchaeia archaeon]